MEIALIVTTVVSIAVAAGMGAVAWRLARAERLRSTARVAARVAAPAADFRDLGSVREQAAAGARTGPMRIHHIARGSPESGTLDLRPGRDAVAGEMFGAGTIDRSGSSLATVLAVGSFAVAASLVLVIATSRGGESIAEPAGQTAAEMRPADGVALELAALGHERHGDRITIRGVVRNPRDGTSLDQLTAIVYLFDRDGGFLGTGGAVIGAPVLAPGAESAFVVRAGGASNVGRYRVSFRIGDRVVPHLDRRGRGASAPPERR
jgi:hypothetical protein